MVNRLMSKSLPSNGRGRPPLSEERRLEILEAFARCVARSGLEATTLDDVAREAGLQRAMIRHYVGNRDTLVREATAYLSAQYLSLVQEALDADGNTLDLDALLDFFFVGDYVFGMPEQNRVFDSLLFAGASDPESSTSLRGIYESIDELVRKHLARRVPGAKPDRIDSVAWAIVCLAEQNIMMLGLGVPRRRSEGLREIARTLIDSLR
jgi:AcrR family transcriptional regulator